MADFERAEAHWLSFGDALETVMDGASPGPAEVTPLGEARGRFLAEDIVARATLPPHANSAMDGFAIRSGTLSAADPPVTLAVDGLSLPGSLPLDSVPEGSAVRIMTGAPLPRGFDSVIRVEHTDGEARDGQVTILQLDDVKKNVRPAGEDLARGEIAVKAGTEVTPGTIAVALACGRDRVHVHARPRVGIVSTGDELVGTPDFQKVLDGVGIPDTNRLMLLSAVHETGCTGVDLGVQPDDEGVLRDSLSSLPELDVLVTTGGASMGERDLLKRVLADLGLELSFWRARIRPGSPVSFAHLPLPDGRRLPVFGLPGNPGSAFVTFQLFVAPFLDKLSGSESPGHQSLAAVTRDALTSPARLTHFFRVSLTWDPDAQSVACALTGPQGSGLVAPLRGADGLAIVKEGVSRIEPGEVVEVILLPSGRIRRAPRSYAPQ